jgi:recombination protein RecR
MNYPKTIRDLIDSYKKLPGIGEKSAERLALASLELDQEILHKFSISLETIKANIKRCNICNNYSEQEICEICSNTSRNYELVCVVEEPKNAFSLEKIGSYNGIYHILDGLISPLDGVNPDDINISSLISRVETGLIKEVIIAVKPSIEGETTSLYILKRLEGLDVTVSKIAYGIPIGADMDYIDSLTLERALEDRKKIS